MLEAVRAWAPAGARALDVGCGEADLHPRLLPLCGSLDACDCDAGDIAFAAGRVGLSGDGGAEGSRPRYQVADALHLPYADQAFDLLLCVDVIEHVADHRLLLTELCRVLRPGGVLVLTSPSADYPWSYDPIHRLVGSYRWGGFGARAYGHDWLPTASELESALNHAELEIVDRAFLTGPLAAATELYWAGLLQRLFKANANNRGEGRSGRPRPGAGEGRLHRAVDRLIDLDQALFSAGPASVGLGFVSRRLPRGSMAPE